ncbi:MAG: protease inhibitor I42 family protein [Bradyrhizobium sp.]|jgi:inhibitor of cysteine peptidase|nr:protease inhibitor I42 family protein [Bradyrhizobium sp.]
MVALVFTASVCGNIIDVPANTPFAVELEENPTTGYRWDFEADPGLEVVASVYTPAQPGGVGGGGVRQVQFRADGPGQFAVRGKLWRSWTGEQSSIKTCEITVRAS